MSMIYDNLEGIPAGMKPTVAPFLLEPEHLNVERMKKLMAMDNSDGSTPLYMEVREVLLPVVPWYRPGYLRLT